MAAMVDLAVVADRVQRAEADAREEQYGQDDDQDADDGEGDDQRPLRAGAARDSRTHFLAPSEGGNLRGRRPAPGGRDFPVPGGRPAGGRSLRAATYYLQVPRGGYFRKTPETSMKVPPAGTICSATCSAPCERAGSRLPRTRPGCPAGRAAPGRRFAWRPRRRRRSAARRQRA